MNDRTTTRKILEAAREDIRRGWCRHATARDANGMRIADPTSPDAESWCAVGAIEREMSIHGEHRTRIEPGFHYGHPALEALLCALPDIRADYLLTPYADLVGFNDDPNVSKEDVLATFDRAIESA